MWLYNYNIDNFQAIIGACPIALINQDMEYGVESLQPLVKHAQMQANDVQILIATN